MAKKTPRKADDDRSDQPAVRTYVDAELHGMVLEMVRWLGCRKATDALNRLISEPIRTAYRRYKEDDKRRQLGLGPDAPPTKKK